MEGYRRVYYFIFITNQKYLKSFKIEKYHLKQAIGDPWDFVVLNLILRPNKGHCKWSFKIEIERTVEIQGSEDKHEHLDFAVLTKEVMF